MIEWIILVVIVIGIWYYFRAKHDRHKAYAVLLILLVVFLFISGYMVITENKTDITSLHGAVSTIKFYFAWLGGLFHNAQTIVTNAIKYNWGGNSTS